MRQYAIITLLFLSIVLGLSITQPAKAATQSLGGTWSVKAGMPTPREGLGAGTPGSKLYAINGYNFGDTIINKSYYPATNTWMTIVNPPTPKPPFGATALVTRVYDVGGSTNAA